MKSKSLAAPWRLDHYFVPLVIFLGLIASLIEAARSPDPLMVTQAWTFGACMMGIGAWYMWMYSGRTPADEKQQYAESVVKAGVVAAMFWGVAGMLVGADSMSRAVGVPTYIADVIVSVSLLAMLVAAMLAQYRVVVRRSGAHGR